MMTYNLKGILGGAAVFISFLNFVYYMATIIWGKTRPHAYTWLIWGLTAAIAYFAQILKGAGSGAWITLAIAVFAFCRTIAAFAYGGSKNITRSDQYFLAACIVAIVIWQVTANALLAILIVTCIDLAGFYPTVRHTWKNPYQENIFSYFLFGLVYFLGVLALQRYNLTTALYPFSVGLACWGCAGYLLWRRTALKI